MRYLRWLMTPTRWDLFALILSFFGIWGSFGYFAYRVHWTWFSWFLVCTNGCYSIGLLYEIRNLYLKFWSKRDEG